MAIRVTIWNEFVHESERKDPRVLAVYPDGIHAALAAGLAAPDLEIRTATMDMPEHGLTHDVLEQTDVLVWWGHIAHHRVDDDIVLRVTERVLEGMGLIVLHSAHASKVFKRLMGTHTDRLCWREDGEKSRLWVTAPGHPIVQGIGAFLEVPADETYAEPFGIPQPETQVFITWYPGGEVFRGGNCYTRGNGRIFYFHPGHETFPIYYQPDVLRVIANAIRWANPTEAPDPAPLTGHTKRVEA